MKNEIKKCNICKSKEMSYYPYGNHLKKLKPVFIKHYTLHYLLFILSLFKLKIVSLELKILFFPKFDIAVCNHCGYGKYTLQLTDNILKRYYENCYWHSQKNISFDPSAFKKSSRAIEQFEFVKTHIGDIASVLEIGAADALFSQYLHSKKTEIKCDIVESGLNWKRYHQESGLSVVSHFFPFKFNRRYDYIHLSHWLEHVLDLDNVIACIKSCMNTKGFVYIEVPNCDKNYWKRDYGDIPHIHFFTIESLSVLFTSYGFRTLVSNTCGTDNNTIRMLFQLQN